MLITGATGRMGQEVVRAVLGANDMELVGAVAADHHGQDIGEVVGVRPVGLPVLDELTPALAAQPEVLVDFTKPDVAGGLAQEALRNGVRPVIGTTALPQADLDAIAELVRETGLSAAIIPNFSIGAVLMMKLAAEVGRFFDHAEIIELHHDQKIDSPSGTALRLQNRVEESMGKECPIHSVRLPGLVAHHEIMFGGLGETLIIRHDSNSRSSFMPGVLHSVRAVRESTGITWGLEGFLFQD